jgi:DNA polymerase-3 subunit gamma/tau
MPRSSSKPARKLEEFSPDYGQVLDDLAALLTRLALQQLVPAYEGDELFDPAFVKELAAQISAEDVQLYYQTAILGRRDLPFAPDPRTGFEMTLVRMLAFRPVSGASATAAPGGGGARATPAATSSAVPSPAVAAIVRPASAGPIDPVQWSRVIGDLDVSGAARQLATNCALVEHLGNTLKLAVDPKVARTPPQIEKLAQALAKYLGGHVKLEFVDWRGAGRDTGSNRRATFGGSARRGAPQTRRRSHGARNEIAFRRHAASGIGAANRLDGGNSDAWWWKHDEAGDGAAGQHEEGPGRDRQHGSHR